MPPTPQIVMYVTYLPAGFHSSSHIETAKLSVALFSCIQVLTLMAVVSEGNSLSFTAQFLPSITTWYQSLITGSEVPLWYTAPKGHYTDLTHQTCHFTCQRSAAQPMKMVASCPLLCILFDLMKLLR